jgi:hypothetical protein
VAEALQQGAIGKLSEAALTEIAEAKEERADHGLRCFMSDRKN